ncbi:hypothetical protein [Bryobacter aggregatus]|uniref:hypothetical protein n=1 Tax=Bryobacter aggregatus TaxID=360054 RepID=UPI0004E0C632|nr:hypothetical protein [Bryobacter aggregatus]
MVSLFLVVVAGSAAVKPGEDFIEPFVLIAGPLVYGFFANLCYSAGPFLDLKDKCSRPREKRFEEGYRFSILLTALPGVWAVLAWLFTLVSGKKL